MKLNFSRLKEPSTWAGIAVLTSFFGVPVGTMELVQQVIVGVAGLVAIFATEQKPKA